MSDSIDGLKQRLVGAFVILTLAIIFLPMIFDKPHVVGNSKIVPVPPRPDFQTVVVKKPEQPKFQMLEVEGKDQKAKLASANDKAPRAVPAQSKPEKTLDKSSEKGAVSQADKPAAKSRTAVSDLPAFQNVWMVQLGTFGDANNAYRLRDKLRNDGFQSHTKALRINGKDAIRVFSGPFVNKLEAEKTKKKLDAKYRVKSLVLFFDP